MFIVPTIYLRGKQVANPAPDAKMTLPTDPTQLAEHFRAAGVEMIHIVDLDAPPVTGPIINEASIRTFTKDFNFHCQISAKTRSTDILHHYFQLGITRCVLGTLAYQQPAFAEEAAKRFPGKVGVEINVRHGKVAIKGWTVAANKTANEYLDRFRDMGITLALYSDVDESGDIASDNLARIRAFAEQARMPVLHNTDLASVDELKQLFLLEKFGIMGTVLNRSLFDGHLDVGGLITLTKEQELSMETDDSTMIPD
jgi:phosphoribosylformimino-5-aminoimidazole carboxamide ribotide isomerase